MEIDNKYDRQEKRQSIRLNKKMPGSFVAFTDWTIPHISFQLSGEIQNLSATGVCARIEGIRDKWKPGLFSGMVKIGFSTEILNETIKILSKTLWMKELKEEKCYMMGLMFIYITTYMQDKIKEYIIEHYLKVKEV